jgi:hypothetical protein
VHVTIAMTNWYIRHHPLRQPDKEMIDESDSDRGVPAIELDESSSDSDSIRTSKIESWSSLFILEIIQSHLRSG